MIIPVTVFSSSYVRSMAFKAFKAKVELQQGKKIKVIHYDRGGEYYGRYDETLDHLRSTFKNVALMLSI